MKENISVVSSAVELANKQRQAIVEQEGVKLVNLIMGERANIKNKQTHIDELKKELKEIEQTNLTYQSVLGAQPTNPTESQKTIAHVIETINKSQQEAVQIDSTNLVNSIKDTQDSIESCEKRIKEYQDKLVKLTSDVVEVSDVVA